MRNFEDSTSAPPKPNPWGFQGFNNTGQRSKLIGGKKKNGGTGSGSSVSRARNNKDLERTGDGRVAGRGDKKGSLAHFMNKQLGKKASGKTGLRKTVFNSEEEEKLHRNPYKQRSLQDLRQDQHSRQQIAAAQSLGNIFMAGAKDKATGKIILPSSLKSKKKKKKKTIVRAATP